VVCGVWGLVFGVVCGGVGGGLLFRWAWGVSGHWAVWARGLRAHSWLAYRTCRVDDGTLVGCRIWVCVFGCGSSRVFGPAAWVGFGFWVLSTHWGGCFLSVGGRVCILLFVGGGGGFGGVVVVPLVRY